MSELLAEFGFTETAVDMRESISIRANAVGTINMVKSFPGSNNNNFANLRGMGEKLMLCMIDEYAFFPVAGMPVILPLLANGASLVMTSSVAGGGGRDGVMAILDAKYPDGTKAVLELNWMRACDACIRRGQSDRCTHIIQPPQHFQRRSDQEKLRALMSPFEGAYEREMMNQQDRPLITPAFHASWIAPLRDRAQDFHNHTGADVRHVFVTVDPSGHGHSRQTVVSSHQASFNHGQTGLVVHPPPPSSAMRSMSANSPSP